MQAFATKLGFTSITWDRTDTLDLRASSGDRGALTWMESQLHGTTMDTKDPFEDTDFKLLRILNGARKTSNGVEADFKKDAMFAIGRGGDTKNGLFKELFINASAIEKVPNLLRDARRQEANNRTTADLFGKSKTGTSTTEKQTSKESNGINPLKLAVSSAGGVTKGSAQLVKKGSNEIKKGSAQLLKLDTVDDRLREARKNVKQDMETEVRFHYIKRLACAFSSVNNFLTIMFACLQGNDPKDVLLILDEIMVVEGAKLLTVLQKFKLGATMKEMHDMVAEALTAKMRMRATYEITIGLAGHIKRMVAETSAMAGANVLLWQKTWKALDENIRKTLEELFDYTEESWGMKKLNKVTLKTWEMTKGNDQVFAAAVNDLNLNPTCWQTWQQDWSYPVTTPGNKAWKDLSVPEKAAIEDQLQCKTFWNSRAGGTVLNKKEQKILLKRWSGSYEETKTFKKTLDLKRTANSEDGVSYEATLTLDTDAARYFLPYIESLESTLPYKVKASGVQTEWFEVEIEVDTIAQDGAKAVAIYQIAQDGTQTVVSMPYKASITAEGGETVSLTRDDNSRSNVLTLFNSGDVKFVQELKLNADMKKAVTKAMRPVIFDAGDPIIEEGKCNRNFYIIERGHVTIESADQETHGVLGKDTCFGDTFLRDELSNMTMKASDECHCLELSCGDFRAIEKKYEQMTQNAGDITDATYTQKLEIRGEGAGETKMHVTVRVTLTTKAILTEKVQKKQTKLQSERQKQQNENGQHEGEDDTNDIEEGTDQTVSITKAVQKLQEAQNNLKAWEEKTKEEKIEWKCMVNMKRRDTDEERDKGLNEKQMKGAKTLHYDDLSWDRQARKLMFAQGAKWKNIPEEHRQLLEMMGYEQHTFDQKPEPEATHSRQAFLLLSNDDISAASAQVHLQSSVAEPLLSGQSTSPSQVPQVAWEALERATVWLQVLLDLGYLVVDEAHVWESIEITPKVKSVEQVPEGQASFLGRGMAALRASKNMKPNIRLDESAASSIDLTTEVLQQLFTSTEWAVHTWRELKDELGKRLWLQKMLAKMHAAARQLDITGPEWTGSIDYLRWSQLKKDQQANATKLGYSERQWNLRQYTALTKQPWSTLQKKEPRRAREIIQKVRKQNEAEVTAQEDELDHEANVFRKGVQEAAQRLWGDETTQAAQARWDLRANYGYLTSANRQKHKLATLKARHAAAKSAIEMLELSETFGESEWAHLTQNLSKDDTEETASLTGAADGYAKLFDTAGKACFKQLVTKVISVLDTSLATVTWRLLDDCRIFMERTCTAAEKVRLQRHANAAACF
jgi:CRP-like cAMP-binding protein